MAKYARGLICLTLTQKRVAELNLPLMSQSNQSRHQTNFTVSIEAREGVTTGISAADRAHTVQTAINSQNPAYDIVTPGHIFPLAARDGGVLVRAGHTEAAVDISRMAGLNPSGVICEIMNDDGTMARLPDLVEFAKLHNMNIASIADLIAYRRKNEKLVERIAEGEFNSEFGDFKMLVYRNKIEYAEHIVLVHGDVSTGKPLVRMHTYNILDDALGDLSRSRNGQLQKALRMISQEQAGAIVIIRSPNRSAVSDQVAPPAGSGQGEIREYGIGAQILQDIGISDMVLLTNSPKSVVALEGYGLKIVDRKEIK
jgi:3,4-dihydroxy 2-butanone 4-phosphate synthase/GTP cyclohydrolase II